MVLWLILMVALFFWVQNWSGLGLEDSAPQIAYSRFSFTVEAEEDAGKVEDLDLPKEAKVAAIHHDGQVQAGGSRDPRGEGGRGGRGHSQPLPDRATGALSVGSLLAAHVGRRRPPRRGPVERGTRPL